MRSGVLTLFGKHPAWSDHMIVTGDTVTGNRLKRLLYDQSLVPAFQGRITPERLSRMTFVLHSGECLAEIVAIPSRDSIGRSRFPLFAALTLPERGFDLVGEKKLEVTGEALRSFLATLFDPPPQEDPAVWQDIIERKVRAFQSPVGSITHPESEALTLSPDEFAAVVRAVAAGERAFTLSADPLSASLSQADPPTVQISTFQLGDFRS